MAPLFLVDAHYAGRPTFRTATNRRPAFGRRPTAGGDTLLVPDWGPILCPQFDPHLLLNKGFLAPIEAGTHKDSTRFLPTLLQSKGMVSGESGNSPRIIFPKWRNLSIFKRGTTFYFEISLIRILTHLFQNLSAKSKTEKSSLCFLPTLSQRIPQSPLFQENRGEDHIGGV
ncbi:unnamed protein product [Citrullus colocynthis]|uniref:Uncharacterized protein n=1 Tax=Citrullus colocynthis TaxID=252529 RepID=A0ABP0YL65_9ROSI